MPRYQYIQNSFSAGEISPKVFPRTDTAEYKNGLKEMDRFFIGKTGGALRTPGFLGVPGQFSNTKKIYFLEIGTRIVTYNEDSCGIGSLVSSALDNYKLAFAEDPLGFTAISYDIYYVMTHSSGNYEPWVFFQDASVSSTYVIGTQLSGLDSLLAAQGLKGGPLNIDDSNRVPYTDFANQGVALTPSGTIGSITITASSSFFTSDDVGTRFIIEDATHAVGSEKVICARITSVSSGTSADALVDWSAGSYTPAASNNWVRSAWSKKLGYPKTVTFSNNRIIFANTRSQPNGVWGSEQFFPFWFNRYTEFLRATSTGFNFYYYGSFGYILLNSVAVDYPANGTFGYSISSKFGDEIKWISDFNGLIAGSSERVYYILGGDNTSGPSRLAVNVVPVLDVRCSTVQPDFSPTAMFVVDSLKKDIYMLTKGADNGISSVNISSIAEGILGYNSDGEEATIQRIRWSSYLNALMVVSSNGTLSTFSHSESAGVAGWSKQSTAFTVTDCAQTVITGHPLLSCVEPVSGKTFTAEMSSTFSKDTIDESCIYLDYAVTSAALFDDYILVDTPFFIGKEVTIILETGEIYEGITMQDLGGTASFTDEVTIPASTSFVLGIPYESRFTLLTPEVGPNQLLSSQGDIIRIDRATAYLYKSWAGEYSGDGNTFYDMEIEQQSNTMKYQFDVNASPDIESNITIKTSKPLPLNVTGIVLRGVNNP